MSKRTLLRSGDELRGNFGNSYVIEECIGEGGTAEVWRAQGPKGKVALKVLAPASDKGEAVDFEKTMARLRNEFKALENVQSKLVVRSLDLGVHEDRPFLVLEYVEGTRLYEWLARENFAPDLNWIEALIDSLCEAAAVLHAKEVDGVRLAHRDINPNNIMIVEREETVRVKLIDLGIALVGRGMTTVGGSAGFTPFYCAPEQVTGHADLCPDKGDKLVSMTGPWTDVFAINVLLFNLGAGRPYVAWQNGAKEQWHRESLATVTNPARRREVLREQAAYLPETVREVMFRGLSPLQGERPGDADVLRRDLCEAWARQGSVFQRVRNVFAPKRETPKLAPPQTCVRLKPTRSSLPQGWHDEVMPEGLRRAEEPGHAGKRRYWHRDPAGGDILMVYIRPGTFWRGSDDGRDSNEKPRHRCTITKGFYLGVYPVTVGQFRRFVEATKHVVDTGWQSPGFAQTEDHPVLCVSWHDAVAHGAWSGLRLPTEAEWEYAARGAIDMPENAPYPEGRMFPWGDRHPWVGDPMLDHVWWAIGRGRGQRLSEGGTRPVDERPSGASPFGVYDMSGNAWEWCADGADQLGAYDI
jgi:serine/threonine protein kinase